MYRVWLEEVLGFKLRGDTLSIHPAIPDDWPGFEITFRYRSAQYEITVKRDAGAASPTIEQDNSRLEGNEVRLEDDGQPHRLILTLPAAEPQQDQSPGHQFAGLGAPGGHQR
jgi:cellobiose phosphorylase